MVKIIDKTPDPAIIKRCTCKNCGVRLEYVPNDIQKYKCHDYGGGCDIIYHIICPNCNENVHVNHC